MRRLLIFAATIAATACEVPTKQCATQRDCFGGEACVRGECVPAVVVIDDVGVTDTGTDMPLGDCRLNEAICGAQVCNVSTGRCEKCQRDLQCGEGGLCDMILGECTCGPEFHACGGQCVRDDDVDSCGERCDPCPGVVDGAATCVSDQCSFTCDLGFRPCGNCGLARDCIQCESNGECGANDASRCDAGLCTSCVTSADCAHLDRKVCSDGLCVQCDIGEATVCGTRSCDPATKLCTSTALQSRQWCETCVADAECEPNHRCVQMFFAGGMRPEAYCLVEANGQCLAPDPIQVQRDSLSGIRGEYYCAIREDLVTCEALRDFGRPCGQDSECGLANLADGLCRTFDGARQCTYKCSANEECANGTTCIGNPPDNSYCARF